MCKSARSGASSPSLRFTALAMPPKLVLAPLRSFRTRPTKKLVAGSTIDTPRAPTSSVQWPRSRWVTASNIPIDQPSSVRPVSLAAPRIVVAVGTSEKTASEGTWP